MFKSVTLIRLAYGAIISVRFVLSFASEIVSPSFCARQYAIIHSRARRTVFQRDLDLWPDPVPSTYRVVYDATRLRSRGIPTASLSMGTMATRVLSLVGSICEMRRVSSRSFSRCSLSSLQRRRAASMSYSFGAISTSKFDL